SMAQLWVVFHPVFRTLYRQGTDTGGLTALRQLVLAQRHSPRFDALIHLLLVLQTSGQRGELRRGGPRWMTHHMHPALPLRVGMAYNHAPIVVIARMGAVGVVGCDRRPTVIIHQGCGRPVGTIARGKAVAARSSPINGEVQERRTVEGDARYHLCLV